MKPFTLKWAEAFTLYCGCVFRLSSRMFLAMAMPHSTSPQLAIALCWRPSSLASLFLPVLLHSRYPSATLSHDRDGLLTVALHPSTTYLALPSP
jgi:hypothetical protein